MSVLDPLNLIFLVTKMKCMLWIGVLMATMLAVAGKIKRSDYGSIDTLLSYKILQCLLARFQFVHCAMLGTNRILLS
jgi:cytochrome b subunit of formate dehydrogenase